MTGRLVCQAFFLALARIGVTVGPGSTQLMTSAMERDIVASIVAMPMLDDESFDAIFCSHCLEHLYGHEVSLALAEFYRVLKPDGLADIRVPDLQSIGGRIALGDIDVVLYNSPSGPITALDMLYGLRSAEANGHASMGHSTRVTEQFLKRRIEQAGFEKVITKREHIETCPEIRALAIKGVEDASEEPEATGLYQLENEAP